MAETSETSRIFVSYRRSESGTAGRIFDRLVAHFGESNVFIDIDDIPYGVDFRQHIGEALRPGDLLLAIVGRNWLGPRDDGTRRIDDETDPVRVEIETALQRDITVLPVLVDDAKMPAAADLPQSIQAFAYRNAAEVKPGRDFNMHADRLIRSIEETLAGRLSPVAAGDSVSKPKGTRRVLVPAALGVAGLMLIAFVAAVYLIGGRVAVESSDSNYSGGRVALEAGPSTYALEATRSKRDPDLDAALNAWNAVKDMDSVAALEAFVARYSDSFYATLAKARLAELKTKEAEKVAMTVPSEPAGQAEPVKPAVGVFPSGGLRKLSNFNDWSVYAASDPKTCFASSKPKSSSPVRAGSDANLFYITDYPEDPVRNEVSVKFGFQLEPNSKVTVRVGSSEYTLFVKDRGAFSDVWEGPMIESMKKASTMTVSGQTDTGEPIRDTYSLLGLTKALENMATVCW